MIRINEPGPLMKDYAACYGCDENEVLKWVLDYCNGPWPDGMDIEEAEKERLESIKSYIQTMVNNSLTKKVKDKIKHEKKMDARI